MSLRFLPSHAKTQAARTSIMKRKVNEMHTVPVLVEGGLVIKKRVAILLAVMLAALPFAACSGSNDSEVPTAKATVGDVRVTVSVSGNLAATDDRLLAFATPGTIEELLVEKGDRVEKGDVLARLETDGLQRNVDMARANLQAVQAQYDMADNQLRQTIYPHYYGSYVIDVPGTWMALDNAIESIERARELMANGELAESNLMLDDVLNEIADAQNSTQARKWDFPIAIKIMELQREAAAAALDVAMLNLEAAQDMIEDAVIEAPFAGVITVVLVEEGDTLTSMNYFNPAFHIIDPTNLEMTGLIDEMDIADISIDQKAIVTMDALPGVEVIGSVTYVSEAAMIEAGVVMYQTTVSLDNADSNIKDGMSATADIVREERENVLMLPASTVMSEDGQTVVYLVGADGKLEIRSVTTGLHSGRMIEITAGLVEGDLVALEAPE